MKEDPRKQYSNEREKEGKVDESSMPFSLETIESWHLQS